MHTNTRCIYRQAFNTQSPWTCLLICNDNCHCMTSFLFHHLNLLICFSVIRLHPCFILEDLRVRPFFLNAFVTNFPFTLLSVVSGPWGPEVARLGCDDPRHPSITQNRLYSDSGRGEICVICSQMLCPLSMPVAGVVIEIRTKMAPLCLIKWLH